MIFTMAKLCRVDIKDENCKIIYAWNKFNFAEYSDIMTYKCQKFSSSSMCITLVGQNGNCVNDPRGKLWSFLHNLPKIYMRDLGPIKLTQADVKALLTYDNTFVVEHPCRYFYLLSTDDKEYKLALQDVPFNKKTSCRILRMLLGIVIAPCRWVYHDLPICLLGWFFRVYIIPRADANIHLLLRNNTHTLLRKNKAEETKAFPVRNDRLESADVDNNSTLSDINIPDKSPIIKSLNQNDVFGKGEIGGKVMEKVPHESTGRLNLKEIYNLPQSTFIYMNCTTIKIISGDITCLDVEAIVNAANSELEHFGGLAKAISTAAGPDFQEACEDYVEKHGEVDVANFYVTPGFGLKCKNIINVVGPMADDFSEVECAELLHRAFSACLQEADRLHLRSIAIPAVSSGIYGVSLQVVAREMVNATLDFLKSDRSNLTEIILIDFNEELLALAISYLKHQCDTDRG